MFVLKILNYFIDWKHYRGVTVSSAYEQPVAPAAVAIRADQIGIHVLALTYVCYLFLSVSSYFMSN